MSSPEFSLEQVLQHARRQEEQKQRELRALTEHERRVRDQLALLREREDVHVRALSARSRDGRIDPGEIDAALAYLGAIEGSITEQLDIVAQVESQVLESRDQLVEILKEKQALENLKHRQAEEALVDEHRREAKANDDITAARFVQRAKEA